MEEKFDQDLEKMGVLGRTDQWVEENHAIFDQFLNHPEVKKYVLQVTVETVVKTNPVEGVGFIAHMRTLKPYLQVAYISLCLGYLRGLYDGEERGKRDARLGEVFRP